MHVTNASRAKTPDVDIDPRPEDPMDWQPTIPPTLTEDLLYDVIKCQMQADLYELCANPSPRCFTHQLPISYQQSVAVFSRTNCAALKLTHRLVYEHHQRALDERSRLYEQWQQAWFWKYGYLLDNFDRPMEVLRKVGPQEQRRLAGSIAVADEALDRLWHIKTRLIQTVFKLRSAGSLAGIELREYEFGDGEPMQKAEETA